MIDRELRVAERRWRESGALEDELRHLRARLRLGLLDDGHVRLAAALGHRASGVLCDGTWPGDGEQLLLRLGRIGVVRFGFALAHRLRLPEGDPRPRQAIKDARAWLASDMLWRGMIPLQADDSPPVRLTLALHACLQGPLLVTFPRLARATKAVLRDLGDEERDIAVDARHEFLLWLLYGR